MNPSHKNRNTPDNIRNLCHPGVLADYLGAQDRASPDYASSGPSINPAEDVKEERKWFGTAIHFLPFFASMG